MKTTHACAILGSLALLSGCASAPADTATSMDFAWGCWVQKDASGGEIEAVLRLLPDKTQNMSTEYSGDVSVGSSRVDLQACKLEYSIVSPK